MSGTVLKFSDETNPEEGVGSRSVVVEVLHHQLVVVQRPKLSAHLMTMEIRMKILLAMMTMKNTILVMITKMMILPYRMMKCLDVSNLDFLSCSNSCQGGDQDPGKHCRLWNFQKSKNIICFFFENVEVSNKIVKKTSTHYSLKMLK